MKGGSTRAAVRYLCLKYGYYPDDPMRAQECDMITDAYYDVFNQASNAIFGKEGSTIPEEQEKYFTALDKFLTFLEPFAARGSFLCGNKLCAADFWVGHLVFAVFKNPTFCFGVDDGRVAKRCQDFPAFAAYCERFCAANQKRMQTRKTPRPW